MDRKTSAETRHERKNDAFRKKAQLGWVLQRAKTTEVSIVIIGE